MTRFSTTRPLNSERFDASNRVNSGLIGAFNFRRGENEDTKDIFSLVDTTRRYSLVQLCWNVACLMP